jgi:hypothetical protein
VGVYLRSADRAAVCEGGVVWRRFVGGECGECFGVWADTGFEFADYAWVWVESWYGIWVFAWFGVWVFARFGIWAFAGDFFADDSDCASSAAAVIDRSFADKRGFLFLGDGAEAADASVRAYDERE